MPIKPVKHMRIWPAAAAPLGLTLILGAALCLFISKVRADAERITSEALRLESYARLEAGELAARAGTAAKTFVDARLAGRAEQERNIRVELRSILEAANEVIAAGLEKTRMAADAPRSDVGEFPPGFEGLRVYLELAGPEKTTDFPVEAMRASIPELASLIPAGASLAVIENNVQEILSVGGGAVPENARVENIAREFAWSDGNAERRWTIRAGLAEADAHPVPDAAEIARHITGEFVGTRLDGATWRGWLVDAAGQATATFPVAATAAAGEGGGEQPAPEIAEEDLPPFINMPGEWVEVDGRRLVWQERAPALAAAGVTPAAAVSIDRPAEPPVWHRELRNDARWSLTLAVLAFLAAGTWMWFAKAVAASRRQDQPKSRRAATATISPNPVMHPAQPAHAAQTAQALQIQNALAAAKARSIAATATAATPAATTPAMPGMPAPEQRPRQRLDDDEVIVEAEAIPAPPLRKRLPMPAGSLLRLQERHRGGKGRQGSRILDHAKSQVLRELARRVRPVIRADAPREMPGFTECSAPAAAPKS